MNSTAKEVFRELAWDSEHFGLKIGRVMERGAGVPETAVLQAAATDVDCLYLLADSQDVETLRSAAAAGFRMVDIRVTFSAKVSSAADHTDIRLAVADDIPLLSRMAIRSHRDSRFYADGRFPIARCDALFAAWIERSCTERSLADAVFIVEAGGKPVGYVTCALKGGVGEIGLIAVDQDHRGRGLGRALLDRATNWCLAYGIFRMLVATQGSNVKAIRLYERAGFRVDTVQVWFHWWRP